jgi:hypothetical protein
VAVHDEFILPGVRAVLRRAVPNLVEAKIVPLVLFLGCYRTWGVGSALVSALAWTTAVLARRILRGHRVSGLLVLGLVGLLAKTTVALLSGSLLLYFVQPTLTTALVGLVFLGSVVVDRPLAERLVHDLWPLEPHWSSHADLRRFFRHLSVLWAATSMMNAAVTLWLLATQPLPTFVMVKSVLGPLSALLAVVPSVALLVRALRRRGVRVVWSSQGERPLEATLAPLAA